MILVCAVVSASDFYSSMVRVASLRCLERVLKRRREKVSSWFGQRAWKGRVVVRHATLRFARETSVSLYIATSFHLF